METLKMYDLVFTDIVKNYVDDYNYSSDDKITITEEGIKEIAHKLIYKNEYIWQIINETINVYLEDYIKED